MKPLTHCSVLAISAMLFVSPIASALTFTLPSPKDSLITELSAGATKQTTARDEDDLLDIARRFDLGQYEIIRLNPSVDRWLPKGGTLVQLQSQRLLPRAGRSGLVINLPEYRLYFFPPASGKVISHPISIGRQDWNTPLGKTSIAAKVPNPEWRPPESIKREHLAKGDPLPDAVPAGPNNPLGLFAMRLGIPGYLIHSTNKPFGVGMRVSHGCIRMYPEDMKRLFPQIKTGMSVELVNQPIKVGWHGDELYIEVHPPLDEFKLDHNTTVDAALDLIEQANGGSLPVLDGGALRKAVTEKQGLPIMIYQRTNAAQKL